MDVRLKPFDFAQAVARAGLRPDGTRISSAGTTAPAEAAAGGSFQASMAAALRGVSDSQNDATALQRELQLGNPEVGIEQTMLAMQKSSIGFQATLAVRNRLVQAYSDIMNMQV